MAGLIFFLIEQEYIYTLKPYKYFMIHSVIQLCGIIEGQGKIEYVKAMDDWVVWEKCEG